MANLSITAADVKPVVIWKQTTGPTDEAIDAGEVVRLSTTTGKITQAKATSAAEGRILGVAITTASYAGQTMTVVMEGILDVGDALASEDYDEELYLSDTDGKIDDGDGSPTANYSVGRVWPGWGYTTADKLLRVEANLAG